MKKGEGLCGGCRRTAQDSTGLSKTMQDSVAGKCRLVQDCLDSTGGYRNDNTARFRKDSAGQCRMM
jgi:hypothetical protein